MSISWLLGPAERVLWPEPSILVKALDLKHAIHVGYSTGEG